MSIWNNLKKFLGIDHSIEDEVKRHYVIIETEKETKS